MRLCLARRVGRTPVNRQPSIGVFYRCVHSARLPKQQPMPNQLSAARIECITTLTPTVRKLDLLVRDDKFAFQPGQWVDFLAPGIDAFTGFSLCSSPSRLPHATLAVKRSRHPSAAWCFEQARVGDMVHLRPGGSFMHRTHVDPSSGTLRLAMPHASHLLLVAGGVGINPFVSVLDDLLCAARAGEVPLSLPRVSLLYSAPTLEEFPFLDSITRMAADPVLAGSVHVERFVTRQPRAAEGAEDAATHWRRLGGADLQRVITSGTSSSLSVACSQTLALLCGPPPMAEGVAAKLVELGIPEHQVWFERWW